MEKFNVFYESATNEVMTVEEIYYLQKDYRLNEFAISENDYYYIRQWKDIPMEYITEDYDYYLQSWTCYLTDWTNLISVWHWYTEDDFEEWVEECREIESNTLKVFNS